MNSPADRKITLVFISSQLVPEEQRWWARLEFPASSKRGDVLPVYVSDKNGGAIAEGTFMIFGAEIKITDGSGGLPYEDFIRGKHEKGVWLFRRGTGFVPGGLTFA